MRVDPEIMERALDEAVARFEADCERHFPRGAVLDVRITDGVLSVLADGEDVSGVALHVVRIAVATLNELREPVPTVLTANDVIALMGLELHHDPASFSLAQ